MSNCLSSVCTKTGDDGTTSLGDGVRVLKDDKRIIAGGTIDELNCHIGLLLTNTEIPKELRVFLYQIQQELLEFGAEISIPNKKIITEDYVNRLEAKLSELNTELPSLKEFLLPGGSRCAAECHVARAVCRRAECCLAALSRESNVNECSICYLNRLSDFLFVAAR